MDHHDSTKKRQHKKDDADLFREHNLRAIRRRKQWSQYLFLGIDSLCCDHSIVRPLPLCMGGVNMLYI